MPLIGVLFIIVGVLGIAAAIFNATEHLRQLRRERRDQAALDRAVANYERLNARDLDECE